MRYLGTTDDVTTCDCCGREDLKSTVAIEDATGNTVYYGVICAAKALKTTSQEVRKSAKAADDAKAKAEREARYAAMEAETQRWFAWLDRNAPVPLDWGGMPDRQKQFEALGGFSAARARYKTETGHEP